MRINIDDIPEEGLHLDLLEDGAGFRDISEGMEGMGLSFLTPITAHMTIERSQRGVLIFGDMETRLQMICSRCLREFEYPIHLDIDLTLVRDLEEVTRERELKREELDLNYYEGRELETTDILREQLALEIPIKPLCRSDCKGLCPRCGADLNIGECRCPKEGDIDPRFARLKEFKVKGEG